MRTPPRKITGIAVIFMVQSLERTRRFYAEAVGLQLDAQDGYLLAKLPSGTELLFFEGEATRGTSPQVVFGLDDGGIDAAAEALAAQGVQLLTPVTEAPGGWSLEFKDPDGHPIAFFQDQALPRQRQPERPNRG
jgi:predicted enzyme related to lactoylglutathione lyase